MPRLSQTQKNYYEQWNKAEAQLKLTHKLEIEKQQQNSLSDYKNQLELMTNTMLENSVAPLKEQIKQQQKEIEKLKWQLSLTANETTRQSKELAWRIEEKSSLITKALIFLLIFLVMATSIIVVTIWAYKKLAVLITTLSPAWFIIPMLIAGAGFYIWIFKPYDQQ